MIHNKVFKTIISLLPCVCISPFFATSCTVSPIVYKDVDGSDWQGVASGSFFDFDEYDVDEENLTVTYNSSRQFKGKNIIVPNYVKINPEESTLYKVLIGPSCFESNWYIAGSFECNDFIDFIPDKCFYNSSSLEKIIMHQYPISIGEYAFENTRLSKFLIRQQNVEYDNWTMKLQTIGQNAFYDLSSLNGFLFFTESLRAIGKQAFFGCSKLTGVDFRFCEHLVTIPYGTFSGCVFIETLVLPPKLQSIDQDAFSGCMLLKIVTLPVDNMCFILGNGTFYGCSSLYGFSRDCQIKSIGPNCFATDTSLSADFMPWQPGGLQYIASTAFAQTNYSTVKFYKNYPIDIGNEAFSDCTLLNCIDFREYGSTKPPRWTGKGIFNGVSDKGTIFLPSGAQMEDWQKIFIDPSSGEPIQGIVIGEEKWQILVS